MDVLDPELPVLTLGELGVIRAVVLTGTGVVQVSVTPTYSGCPALARIQDDIRIALAREGFPNVAIDTVLAPPWTTDWISEEGRRKLADHGLAPPGPAPAAPAGAVFVALTPRPPVACPQCASRNTREISRFSGTACKSLHTCLACGESFEHLKAI